MKKEKEKYEKPTMKLIKNIGILNCCGTC